MQPQIRDALPTDAEAIGRLMRVLGYELAAARAAERLAAYGGDFSNVWVACHEEEIIGFLAFHAIPLFHETAMLGRITAMSVEPRCQRQGVGAALVKKAEISPFPWDVSAWKSQAETGASTRRISFTRRLIIVPNAGVFSNTWGIEKLAVMRTLRLTSHPDLRAWENSARG